MFISSAAYPMDPAGLGLPGDASKDPAVVKIRKLRRGLVVLRALQVSLAFATFVVTAAWLASYVPVAKSLRNRQLTRYWSVFLDWTHASIALAVCLMLQAIFNMLIALLGLYYTIRDHQRKHYHHLLSQLLPDSTYRVDLAYDASAALWWFVLLIAMAIVDSRYMSALGLTLSTLNPDPLSAAVIALPVLVLVVCVVLAVFSGLMWKEMRRQNTRIVPQTFTTVYNI